MVYTNTSSVKLFNLIPRTLMDRSLDRGRCSEPNHLSRLPRRKRRIPPTPLIRAIRWWGFSNDRELLLHRPVAPSRNAPDNLNTRLRTTHTTGRMTARIRIILANHSALRSWNTQTAKSAQTMQGGLQTTLTEVRFSLFQQVASRVNQSLIKYNATSGA